MSGTDGEARHGRGRSRGASARATVLVSADSPFFAGHFEGYPVFPAVAQLTALVLPEVRAAWPELGALEEVSRVRFVAPVRPDVELGLELVRDGDRVRFAVKGAEPISSGTLRFAGGGS